MREAACSISRCICTCALCRITSSVAQVSTEVIITSESRNFVRSRRFTRLPSASQTTPIRRLSSAASGWIIRCLIVEGTLIVGQAKAPTISSDGVTVEELRSYLLSQPGISPQLAAAIRAIGDPSSTLPVPVPAELAISHPVTVQGVQGLYIGDNTGIASAVIWQKDGMMFEVIGSFTESQALSIANSMR